MMRPEFVTDEDIARWSENLDNDLRIPIGVVALPLLREVMYAGLWLGEQLQLLACNELLIVRIQYTAGQLSFGRDPWEVVQELLTAYKNNDLEFEIDYNEDRS
jgi:hypothetical protein